MNVSTNKYNIDIDLMSIAGRMARTGLVDFAKIYNSNA